MLTQEEKMLLEKKQATQQSTQSQPQRPNRPQPPANRKNYDKQGTNTALTNSQTQTRQIAATGLQNVAALIDNLQTQRDDATTQAAQIITSLLDPASVMEETLAKVAVNLNDRKVEGEFDFFDCSALPIPHSTQQFLKSAE